ncbi:MULTISPECIES: HAMP domain-containing sensor histidine kinase [Trichocoleus]|uniref:histidine kinase n=1 Tax=Trichocoleus desertorum GB2-A4 TaxID=2933944 RepID=A0ABV0J8G7_9CYAN|nr:HAMP domain-containing sensor histidine kinase [Trichocoleus sp. FACHB-46]MBD1861085.1 HAMP domain-containing histidine kinase [Trichocoleus sp. FACHB-46]
MKDFGRILVEKTEAIVEQWVEAVHQDQHIESADDLSPTAIRNHIPHVLAAMATVLCESQDSNVQELVAASLNHGIWRAEQGFDPREIAREYRLLRSEIFTALQTELLQAEPAAIIRAFRLIDVVVDEAIAQCFKSYVEERLRELDQLQSQLALTNQELTRLVRTSQENLSLLAHELKTPLNSIIGYSELFLRQQQRQQFEVKDNFPSIENIERVLRHGRGLLRLINNVLELSRYEAGNMQLQLTEIDVRLVVNSVMEMLEPVALAKGLILDIDYDAAPAKIATDPLRLQQVITNLISNAIRYTDTGTVHVQCHSLPDQHWSIAIADTGLGISSEDQVRVFDPYFRVNDHSPSVLPESTGLGLAIVARLVQLLQGQIQLVSELHVGSTFTVVFPQHISAANPSIGLTSLVR